MHVCTSGHQTNELKLLNRCLMCFFDVFRCMSGSTLSRVQIETIQEERMELLMKLVVQREVDQKRLNDEILWLVSRINRSITYRVMAI